MPDSVLKTGDSAPNFSLPRDGGETVSLSDFSGKVLVLFFYPKDDTPGCTTESIGFTQSAQAFEDAGATVLGVSKDSVNSHEKFAAKHALTVPLLSDENGDMCESYGVWAEKNNFGRKYMGIVRSTFLISDGKLQKIWRKVKVDGHVEEVLAAVQAL